MKKKIVVMMLAVSMFCLAGCGKSTETSKETNTQSQQVIDENDELGIDDIEIDDIEIEDEVVEETEEPVKYYFDESFNPAFENVPSFSNEYATLSEDELVEVMGAPTGWVDYAVSKKLEWPQDDGSRVLILPMEYMDFVKSCTMYYVDYENTFSDGRFDISDDVFEKYFPGKLFDSDNYENSKMTYEEVAEIMGSAGFVSYCCEDFIGVSWSYDGRFYQVNFNPDGTVYRR